VRRVGWLRERAPAFVLAAIVLAAPAHGAQTHLVVVAGLGGEPAYEARFAAQAKDLAQLGGAIAGDPARVRMLSGKAATREAIRSALDATARAAGRDDVVIVAWIGHGNVDGAVYKFNVPGPDPTCEELRQWLDRVPAARQLVVLATSAGGACVAPLAREGRVVMSATRSGSERNAPLFARYFVEALRDPLADGDHDDTVTGLEAFRYAEQKVQRFYADEKRLATEHAVLSSESARDFVLARRGSALRAASGGPESVARLGRKEALGVEISALRSRKAELPREQYLAELERLLLDLARVQEALDVEAAP
jgi:hypothetical protein